MSERFEQIQQVAEDWRPEQVLTWAWETFGYDVAMATGFGIEGVALLDIASRVNPKLRVFTGDTEFLFPETYDLIDRVEKHYGIKVERTYSELSPEEQERQYGPALWERNPDQCCNLRKIEPLRDKLATLEAWITAIRRDQTAVRAGTRRVEWDAKFQLIKINPIADWTMDMVWKYVREHDVPHNPLHDRGYPSIGCMQCTRAVQPGEGPRAGRWSGFKKTECGLHVERTTPSSQLIFIENLPVAEEVSAES
ncbi:MAG: phosphoadenosine phosphosulfate reductase [Acidobacteriaceae bacterium]